MVLGKVFDKFKLLKNYLTNCFIYRIDSIMLLEEGFQVTSIDASDKMLKYALKKRWARRKEEAFDNWGKVRLRFVYFTFQHLINLNFLKLLKRLIG